MGLVDFAKKKLIDALTESTNVEEDISDSTLSGNNDEEEQIPQCSDEVYLAWIASQERQAKEEAERNAEEERIRREREKEEKRIEREEAKQNQKKAEDIYNAPMPEAKDIILEIKTCEQKSGNNSLSYEEQQAYESRAKLLKEYAKQKYANDHPVVKAYLRKDTLHNKRFLIMWCVLLVVAVVVFIVCEEWWHYVLAVLGTIVVAVVLFFIQTFGD